MRRILAMPLLVVALLLGLALPADAHTLPQYTYAYTSASGCTLRAIYGQYGNDAFAEWQQVASPGSKCSAWSGVTLLYHDGSQVRRVYCSVLGEAYNPAPHCVLLGPGMGIRAFHAGALLEMQVHLCWWTFDPGEIYPPCYTDRHYVF